MVTDFDLDNNIKNIDFLKSAKEGQYFDRKSARIKPKDILKPIIAFANAAGGYLVIGIEDNGEVTGFKMHGAHSIDEYKNISFTELKDTPLIVHSFIIPVKNNKNIDDEVLILSIQPSQTRVIKSQDGHVYLRFGDKSQELNYEQIIQLKYDKGEQFFEDEVVANSSIEDIDIDIVNNYKSIMHIDNLSIDEILKARYFLVNDHLTNAGVLLFAKNPSKFLPQARLRFIRYDGTVSKVGKELNIVKEKTFDGPIPRIIKESKDFISTQFREFQFLDEDGTFKRLPEYPEFAWFEGIVNALTHRNYSIRGEHIKVIMYDDRLEIHSPGILPNIVTVENILNQRYSRNPRIARILSEFGWVKEMNEGVKRIYSEMEKSFLNDPIYSEPNNNSVLLLLENNILSRTMRNIDSITSTIGKNKLKNLSKDKLLIVRYAFNTGSIETQIAARLIGKSTVYSRRLLKELEKEGIFVWHGTSKNDPTQYYTFNFDNK